ncbi:hypothetical protein BaRGS_00003665 [Batillaria attramentaria]|uniref:Exonuclease domain-containing protein n=1 Tax=Batillaria attramentaria TaxID=370345 RepID=A0ABD0M0N7_9CAEN
MDATSNASTDKSRRHKIASLVVFDTETTGLPGPGTKITELCFLSVQRDEVISKNFPRVINKLQLCLSPERALPPPISTITGLYNDHLEHMAKFGDAAPLIERFLACQPRPLCIIAHNGNRFDFPLLQAEMRAANQPLPADTGILCADSLEAFRMLDGLPAVPEWVIKKEMKEKKRTNIAMSDTRDSGLKQEQGNNNINELVSAYPAMADVAKQPSDEEAEVSVVPSQTGDKRTERSTGNTCDAHGTSTPAKLPKLEDHSSTAGVSWHPKIIDSQSDQTHEAPYPGNTPTHDEPHNEEAQVVPSNWQPNGEHTPPTNKSIHPPDSNIARQFVKKGQPADFSDEERDRVSRRLFDSDHLPPDNTDADNQHDFTLPGPPVTCTVPSASTEDVCTGDILHLSSQASLSDQDLLALAEEVEAKNGITSLATQDGASGDSKCVNTDQGITDSEGVSQSSTSERNAGDSVTVTVSDKCGETLPQPSSSSAAAARVESDNKGKSAAKLTANKTPNVSYRLGMIHQRVFGSPPDAVHTAEDDCNTLLRLILNRAPEFIEWLDEHAIPLDAVQPMY